MLIRVLTLSLACSAATLASGCSAPTEISGGEQPPPASEDGAPTTEDETGTGPDSATTEDVAVEDTASKDTAVADTAIADTAVDAGCVLPPRDCEGTAAHCAELVPFEPVKGPGYDNYPLNGETLSNQYRSYCRRDLMMLVKYAAAYVECYGKSWTPGNGAPLGLGDMSEKSGAIPGTSIGSPGHPSGTHTDGSDMDIAYYQTSGTNNYLRPICPHTSGGVEQYHCTGEPTILDVKRTALFLGAFVTSSRTRIIGVDGKVGPLVSTAMTKLCEDGTLPKLACDRKSLITWEATDTGRGWFQFHHHHLHVSVKKVSADWSPGTGDMFSADGAALELDHLRDARVLGHAHIGE